MTVSNHAPIGLGCAIFLKRGWLRLCSGTVLCFLLLSAEAYTQVFQVGGGASSLFSSSGGAVELHGQHSSGWFGIGSLNGRLRLGAAYDKQWRDSTLIFGDNVIPFHMPTDVFDESHYFEGRGLGISRTRDGFSMLAFGGMTTTGFSGPFFHAASPEDGAGVLFLDEKLSPHFRLFSRNIISNRQTSIHGAAWQPRAWLTGSLAGGIGANQAYMASSVTTERPWITARAAYVLAGDKFRRATVPSPVQTETDRENIFVRLSPKPFVDFSAGRFNVLSPVTGTAPGLRATVNQFSANASVYNFRLASSVFRSAVHAISTTGTTFSLGRNFGNRIQADGFFFRSTSLRSPATSSITALIHEVISPRLTLLQTVTDSAGHVSPAFGGQFISNFITIGAEYQTVFAPFRTGNPFRQVMLLSIRLHPFGDFRFDLSSYVAPDGSVKYTTGGQTSFYHGQEGKGGTQRVEIPKYIVSGRVLDEELHPVAGAALWISEDLVFTDSQGVFTVRRRKDQLCRVRVALGHFLVPGAFEVISAPDTVVPATEGAETPLVIILRPTHAVLPQGEEDDLDQL